MRCRLLAIALLAAGCTPDICSRHSDCASGMICTATGECAIPADAGIDAQAVLGSPTTVEGAAIEPPDHDAGPP
jgi:hypothetical protein